MAYHYVNRGTNCIMDDMARRTLEARATITFWDGQLSKDTPRNQLHDVYEQQGKKPCLNWGALPEPFD